MYRLFFRLLPAWMLVLLALPACSPAFNWRYAHLENTRLALLLPCKPDQVQRTVSLGGRPTQLRMIGCAASGATFAAAVAELADAGQAGAVLAQWQDLTLANMKAPLPSAPIAPSRLPTQVGALKVPGASPAAPPVLLKARGQRADGTAVVGQAAYFAQGAQIFQVAVFAETVAAEVSETFFSSLKFE